MEEKMKNKHSIILAVILICVMMLTSCAGGTKNKEAGIMMAVDGVMHSVKTGEYSRIYDYLSSDAKDGEVEEMLDFLENIHDQFSYSDLISGVSDFDLDEETSELFDALFNRIIDEFKAGLVKSYKIGKITEETEDAEEVSIPVEVTFGYDFEAFENDDMESIIAPFLTDYLTENMDELEFIYENEGDEGVVKRMLEDLSGDYYDEIVKSMLPAEETTKSLVFTVVEEDGKWLVSDITSLD